MAAFTEPDPAKRRAFNRLFHRNRRPTWFGHWVSHFFCWARLEAAHGVASSGRKHFPLPVGAPLDDFAAIAAEYLVYRVEPAA